MASRKKHKPNNFDARLTEYRFTNRTMKGDKDDHDGTPCEQNVCVVCNTTLHVGVAYYLLFCHIHAICRACLKPEDTIKDHCFVCEELTRQEETRTRVEYEPRNSMPIINLADNTAVKFGPRSKTFDYPSQFRRSAPVHRLPTQFEEINLPHEITNNVFYNGLFPTPYPDTIVACDDTSLSLHVLNADGSVISHRLSEGDRVHSATFITPTQYLLCTGYHYNNEYQYKLHVANLNISSTTATMVTPRSLPLLNTEIRHPIQVFNICRQRYGVLCSREYRKVKGYYDSEKERDTYRMNIIHVLPLDTLTLQTDTHLPHSVQYIDQAQHMIQSNVLWGRRTIRLEGSDGYMGNTVCVTPGAGHFCLAGPRYDNIRIYSRTGLSLVTLSSSSPNMPRAIMCTGSSDVIVMGIPGKVQVFTPRTSSWRCDHGERGDDRYGKWVQVRKEFVNRRHDRYAWYSVLSESHMWCMEVVKRDESKRLYDYFVLDGQSVRNCVYKVRVYKVQ